MKFSRSTNTGSQYRSKFLKGNKYDLASEIKTKNRKTKVKATTNYEVSEYSAEIEVLYKMFVPTKILVKNDRLSLKQLMNHLPYLIPQEWELDYDLFNFEIHLFLSSIMTNFILPWYIGKLKTDSFTFCQRVYHFLMDVIEVLIHRSLRMGEYATLNATIDDLFSILNEHIVQFRSDNDSKYELKVIDSFITRNERNGIISSQPPSSDSIVREIIENEHVIFSKDFGQNGEVQAIDILDGQDGLKNYLRVLSMNILGIMMQSTVRERPFGDINSEISISLITVILSDLVLLNTVNKLSSPDFILFTSISFLKNLSSQYLIETTKKSKKTDSIAYRTVTESFKRAALSLKCVIGIIYSFFFISISIEPIAILSNSFFCICDTLTGFSRRNPFLSGLMVQMQRAILSRQFLSNKIDEIFLRSTVRYKSDIFSDATLSRVIKAAREALFDDDDSISQEEHKKSLDELSKEICDLIKVIIGTRSSFKFIATLLGYGDSNAEELKHDVYKTLMVFNYDTKSLDNDVVNSSSNVNRLLVVKSLDYLMLCLFPELADPCCDTAI